MAGETTRRRGAREAQIKDQPPATSPTNDASVDGPIKDLLLRAGHTQIAALTAASRFWASWAAAADRYTQALGSEICDAIEGRLATGELSTRFADATSAYLREMTDLPTVAVAHFNDQIAKEPRNRGPRVRRARAKV
jgi:hypothetical protein